MYSTTNGFGTPPANRLQRIRHAYYTRLIVLGQDPATAKNNSNKKQLRPHKPSTTTATAANLHVLHVDMTVKKAKLNNFMGTVDKGHRHVTEIKTTKWSSIL